LTAVKVTNDSQLRKIREFMFSDKSHLKPRLVREDISLKEIKKRNPLLHIFMAEDEEGKVRAVVGVETRGVANPTEPKIWDRAWWIIDHKDLDGFNAKYALEALDCAIRYGYETYGLERLQFRYNEAMRSRFILDLLRDYITLLEITRRPETGTVLAHINMKKYLGIQT